jgi:predicted unusual protein kinase regulating ubiquinone biosynthesis (AarF/ABC1/UbiB family)
VSRLKRLATLGGLTSRVTSSYLGARVRDAFLDEDRRKRAMQRLHLDNAEQIATTLAQMKGAAMKLGQQLAVAATSLDLPPEVVASLSKLHKDAEAVPFDVIRADIEASIGAPLAEAYAWFDEVPLGTASLGQAHRARLADGTAVVVKVLHRGVANAVDTDLLALKAVLIGSRALRRSREEVDAAFEEIRERLSEELDYLQEAVNLQQFAEAFASDPRVRIPRLHHALCTERVLTMDELPGRHLDAFLVDATREARQRAGATLADLYYHQVFTLRMLHADPHPGNYLFEDDGRVGLVDFGCVKRFDLYWAATYARTALAAMAGDKDAVLAGCFDLGAWNGTDPEDAELLWTFADQMCAAFRAGEIELGPEREQLMEALRPILKRFLGRPSIRIPKHVLFTHRSLGGLYAIHRRLGTRADFGACLVRHATVAVADAADGSAA